MEKSISYKTFIEAFSSKIADYKELVKLRLSLMVVFSSLFAYVIAASSTVIVFSDLLVLFFGGMFVTGAANALNQVLEKDFDRNMNRTENRPLPQGRMTISEAVLAAGWMAVIGILLLATFNALTGMIAAISLVLYAFVYTPLKRISPISVFVGAIPGALPTMIGCVAIQGEMTPLALLLFGVQFFWQFPHFWAIAELAKDDYRNAGYKIISDDADAKSLGLQSLLYATMIIPMIGGLYMYDWVGIVNSVFLLIITLAYMFSCVQFSRKQTRKSALTVMFGSFAYLPLFLIAMIVESFI